MKPNFFNIGLHLGAVLLFFLIHTVLVRAIPEIAIIGTYFVGLYAMLRLFMKPIDKRMPLFERKEENEDESISG